MMTMPNAVPGAPSLPNPGLDPLAGMGYAPEPLAPDMGGMGGMGGLGAGLPPIGGMAPPQDMGGPGEQKAQFIGEEQEDGTIVLFRMRPDGSKGPVVKVMPGIKKT